MTWFKVDDGLHSHPKAIAAGDAALGTWVRLGSWCSKHSTDGKVPRLVAETMARPAQLRRLLDVGLLESHPEGYLIHDFLVYNPSREKIVKAREDTAARVAKWRAVRTSEQPCNGVTDSVTPLVTNDVRTPAPTRPDPTRPVTTKREPQPPPSVAPSTASFDAWWEVYPRKVGKRTARAAYDRARRRATTEMILDGAVRYRDDPNREKPYTAHPTTWLNRDGWQDEPCQPRNTRPNKAEERDRHNVALIEHFRSTRGEIA